MKPLTLIRTITEWFIPDVLKQEFLTFRQSKIVIYFSLLGIVFYGYNIIKWYKLEIYVLAISLSVIICLTLAMLFVLKYTGLYKLVGYVTITMLFFHFSFLAYLGGGLDAKTILWNLLIPIMSYIIVGSRSTLIWFSAVLIEVIVFYFMKKANYVFPGLGLSEADALTEQLIGVIGPFCALTIIIIIFELMNTSALNEMKMSQEKSQNSADFLRKVIDKVNVQAEALAESSQFLMEKSGRMSSNITTTSDKVSEIVSLVNNLSTLTGKVNQNSSKVMTTSGQGLNTTESGVASVEEMKQKMAQIERNSQTSTREIAELNEHSKKINTVMDIINTIADQTKLIAFNASLEASSAGEAGKRFSVVAVEIRRLADNVMKSTSQIRATIRSINESVERLLIYSEQGSKDIQEGILSLDQIVTILKQILADAKIQSELAKDIIHSTNEQTAINNEVLHKSKEIADGTYDTLQSVQQSGGIATKLATVSKELRQQLEKA